MRTKLIIGLLAALLVAVAGSAWAYSDARQATNSEPIAAVASQSSCVTGDCCCPGAGACCDPALRPIAKANPSAEQRTAGCCGTGNCCCPGRGLCCAIAAIADSPPCCAKNE